MGTTLGSTTLCSALGWRVWAESFAFTSFLVELLTDCGVSPNEPRVDEVLAKLFSTLRPGCCPREPICGSFPSSDVMCNRKPNQEQTGPPRQQSGLEPKWLEPKCDVSQKTWDCLWRGPWSKPFAARRAVNLSPTASFCVLNENLAVVLAMGRSESPCSRAMDCLRSQICAQKFAGDFSHNGHEDGKR